MLVLPPSDSGMIVIVSIAVGASSWRAADLYTALCSGVICCWPPPSPASPLLLGLSPASPSASVELLAPLKTDSSSWPGSCMPQQVCRGSSGGPAVAFVPPAAGSCCRCSAWSEACQMPWDGIHMHTCRVCWLGVNVSSARAHPLMILCRSMLYISVSSMHGGCIIVLVGVGSPAW